MHQAAITLLSIGGIGFAVVVGFIGYITLGIVIAEKLFGLDVSIDKFETGLIMYTQWIPMVLIVGGILFFL